MHRTSKLTAALAAVLFLAGCGYGFYSPSRDTAASRQREQYAYRRERQVADLHGSNASLRQQKSRLQTKLATVQNEIRQIQAEPGADPSGRDAERLLELRQEERVLRQRLDSVQESIQREVSRQNELRQEGLDSSR